MRKYVKSRRWTLCFAVITACLSGLACSSSERDRPDREGGGGSDAGARGGTGGRSVSVAGTGGAGAAGQGGSGVAGNPAAGTAGSGGEGMGGSEAAASPYRGYWEGTTSQELPVSFHVTSEGSVPDFTIRLRLDFGTVACTGDFAGRQTTIVDDAFSTVASIGGISTAPTIDALFTSPSAARGTYADDTEGFSALCGSTLIFGTGSPLSDGTFEVAKVSDCGNGNVEEGEECEGGENCDANCQRIPECGDTLVDGDEECDDGNGDDNDGCTEGCRRAARVYEFPGDFPLSGQSIEADEIAVYRIDGFEPGRGYEVTTQSVGDLSLSLYDDADLEEELCYEDSSSGDESCIGAPTTTSLWVVIESYESRATAFTLDVAEGPVLSTGGTYRFPDDFPLTDQLIAEDDSLGYRIDGLEPGQLYDVFLRDAEYDIGLAVYDDADHDEELCFGESSEEGCTVMPSGTSLWVVIENYASDYMGFTLDVVEGPPVSTGGTYGFPQDFPLNDQVIAGDVSLEYRIDGLEPGLGYVVSIRNAEDEVDVAVYDDAGHDEEHCFDSTTSGNASCTVRPSGSSVWVVIDNYSSEPLGFTLDVAQGPGGVFAYPEDFPLAGQSVEEDGAADYRIEGLESGTSYVVSTSGAAGDIDFTVSGDVFHEDQLCSTSSSSGNESCTATPSGTSLWVTVDNYALGTTTFTLDIAESAGGAGGTGGSG